MWDKIFGNDFLDMMQKAQITKEKIDILDLMSTEKKGNPQNERK